MRIRPIWIAVPACAAAGMATYTMVAAQDAAPPAGYYTPRVTPHPSVVAQQKSYIRPLNDSTTGVQQTGFVGADLPPPSITWTPPAGGTPKATTPPPPTAKPKPIPLGSGDLPPAPPRPKFFPDAAPAAKAPTELPSTLPVPVLPPPTLTAPTISLPSAKDVTPEAPALPPAKPAVELPAISPPKVTVEMPAIALPKVSLEPTPTPEAPKALPSVVIAPAANKPTTVPATNFAPSPLPARQSPTVSLEMVCPEATGVGQPLTFELIVRNTGSSAVAGVRVDDELPAGVAFVNSEPAGEQSGSRLSWAIGTIEAGIEKRIKVTVRPNDEGEVRSRAMASFSTAVEASAKVTRPRVGVVATATGSARVGDEVPVTITLTNTGTGTAQKLVVQAKLSDGLSHTQGAVIEAEVGPLAAGESKPLTLRTTAGKAGPQSCIVTVIADANAPETARVALNAVEPLLQAKMSGPTKCLVRSEPTFTIDLSNPGSAATDPVQAWAVVPDGFEFVQASDGGTFTAANRTVIWKLAPLPAGGSKPVTVKLRSATPADGTVRAVVQATAEVPAGGNGVLRAAGSARVLEAKAETTVRAEGVPALRFEVADLEDPVEVGKDAVYEIKVVNQGTAPCTNVTVTATLAEGTTAAGASGPTSGRGAGSVVTFDAIPTLGVKGEAVYQVKVKGGQPGDKLFKVQVGCDQIRTAVQREENTRFYKE